MALNPSHKPKTASSSKRMPSYGPHPSKNRKSNVVTTTPAAPTQPQGKGTARRYTGATKKAFGR